MRLVLGLTHLQAFEHPNQPRVEQIDSHAVIDELDLQDRGLPSHRRVF